MAPRRTTHTGLDCMTVQIEEIDEKGNAHCIDQFGRHVSVPITINRAKGAFPAVGDQWIIDRAVGNRWSFAAVVNTVPPEITGSRQANPAVASLLTVLDGAGLIQDSTTLGSAPGGGGVTDHGALTGLADDDHPQYLREAEADLLYEVNGAASDAIIAHEGDADPHPQYAQLSLLGTAATADMADFATPAQGAKADTAVQPTRTINGLDLSANRVLPNNLWRHEAMAWLQWKDASTSPAANPTRALNNARPTAAYLDTANLVNHWIEWSFDLDAGTWTLTCVNDKLATNGSFNVTLDGTALAALGGSTSTLNLYNASTLIGQPTEITGIVVPSNGPHTLRFTCTGSGAGSSFGGRWEAFGFKRTA